MRENKRRLAKQAERQGLFSGLLYCADCESKLHFATGKNMTPEQDRADFNGFAAIIRKYGDMTEVGLIVYKTETFVQILHVDLCYNQRQIERKKKGEREGMAACINLKESMTRIWRLCCLDFAGLSISHLISEG